MENMTFHRHLARLALRYSRADVTDEARRKAIRSFIDTFGCVIAGANETPSRIINDYARERGGAAVGSVVGVKGLKLDPYSAILSNGTAAHFHDVDDVSKPTDGHPSVAVLPAVITGAELTGASGEDALLAYMAGMQVIKLVGIATNKNSRFYSIGWHSTPTLGIFGATAALGRLYGLTEDQLVMALGIATSEAAGLKGNFGTMVKPFHAGKCCADAYLAVSLAKRGFTANPEVFEGKEGYASVTVKTLDMDDFYQALEQNVSIFVEPGINMKPWPCCKQNHSSINAIQVMRQKHGFTADDVDHVLCRVQPLSYGCLKYTQPVTKLQGKFSIQYNVAVALLYGDVRLSDYDGVNIEDERVFATMPKISMEIDDSIAGGKYGNGRFDSIVEVCLKDGRMFSEHIIDAKGDPGNPLTDAELGEKFRDCAKRALRVDRLDAILDMAWRVDELDTFGELLDAVGGAAL